MPIYISYSEIVVEISFFIKRFVASKCLNPPVPLGGSYVWLDGEGNSTAQVRFSCQEGLHLIGNDVISCNDYGVGDSGDVDVGSGQRWIGDVPVCAADAALNKPAAQSSLTSLAGKPVHPVSSSVTEHRGTCGDWS